MAWTEENRKELHKKRQKLAYDQLRFLERTPELLAHDIGTRTIAEVQGLLTGMGGAAIRAAVWSIELYIQSLEERVHDLER